jgi:hypothetical protein
MMGNKRKHIAINLEDRCIVGIARRLTDQSCAPQVEVVHKLTIAHSPQKASSALWNAQSSNPVLSRLSHCSALHCSSTALAGC